MSRKAGETDDRPSTYPEVPESRRFCAAVPDRAKNLPIASRRRSVWPASWNRPRGLHGGGNLARKRAELLPERAPPPLGRVLAAPRVEQLLFPARVPAQLLDELLVDRLGPQRV